MSVRGVPWLRTDAVADFDWCVEQRLHQHFARAGKLLCIRLLS